MAKNRTSAIVVALILIGAGGGYLISRSLGGTAPKPDGVPVELVSTTVVSVVPGGVVLEGGSFTVSLPGTPAEENFLGEPGGNTAIHRYVLEPEGEELSYTFEYFDYAVGLLALLRTWGSGDAAKFVYASGRSLAHELGGTVASESVLSLDGYPGGEVRIDGPDGRATTARIYLVGDRLYRLIVTTLPEEASRPEVREFLDSFKLLEPSPSEESQQDREL